jgi:hypothetical protein
MKTGHHQHAFEKFGSALARDPMYTKALLAAGSVMQVYWNVKVDDWLHSVLRVLYQI